MFEAHWCSVRQTWATIMSIFLDKLLYYSPKMCEIEWFLSIFNRPFACSRGFFWKSDPCFFTDSCTFKTKIVSENTILFLTHASKKPITICIYDYLHQYFVSLGLPNWIVDNSDSKQSKFDCPYRFDSKSNDKIVLSIAILN